LRSKVLRPDNTEATSDRREVISKERSGILLLRKKASKFVGLTDALPSVKRRKGSISSGGAYPTPKGVPLDQP
jgi:hypothetical protein